jgi:plastocyanin
MKVRIVVSTLVSAFVLAFSVNAADTGSVKGSVKYDGEPPAGKVIDIPAKDQEGCKCKTQDGEELVVDKATKGIKWASVRIMGVKAEPPAGGFPEVTVDQKGCHFTPHVTIVGPGATLNVLNPDKIGHNVHTTPFDGVNQPINKMMLATEEKMALKGSKYFVEPEVIKLQCDIHPWMAGFIICHDPRFAAITGTDGSFEIKNVPVGSYDVIIFHELGEKTVKVEVKAGAAADVGEVKFKVK